MPRTFLKQMMNATKYSLDGMRFLLKSEFAARIELYFFLWIFTFLVYFELPLEFLISTVILFLFLMAVEALNTAIEVIVDRVSPEVSPMGKQAKDLGSFAVMSILAVNIVHLIFIFSKLNFYKFQWGTTIFLSAVLFFLGLYLATDNKPRKKWKLFIVIAAGIYILMTGIYIASNYFTGVGFDSKVIYHLKTGLKGAGFGEYFGLMFWMSLYAVSGLVLTFFTADLLGNKKFTLSKKIINFRFRDISLGRNRNEPIIANSGISKAQKTISGLVLLSAFMLNPFTQDVTELVSNQRISGSKITDYDFYAQPENLTLSRKRNVVVLYLESLERTYFDNDIFPGLVPNLSQLESANISFTDMRHAYHTEWTVAGMLATQCGVPLYTSSNGNAMGAYDEFMPNALCMGDILKKNGYDLEFMNGADTQFAGKDKFYETHGFETIIGKTKHKEDTRNNGYYSQWGLHDDRLLEIAYDNFIEKSQLQDPFGLFVLTVDTHHPKGHVSNACDGVEYADGSNEMLNAVKCSDRIVSAFIEKIQSSKFAKDTLIVVMSDHMAMQNQASDLLKQGQRRNFFMIMDPYTRKPVAIDRAATSMDVAPTIMSFLGFSEQSLGFGRNLLGHEETLIEVKGDKANRFLISMKKAMQAELWEFPDLSNGLTVDIEDRTITIENRRLSTPAFLTLSEADTLNDLRFFKSNSTDQDSYLRSGVLEQPRFLWVDECLTIHRYLMYDKEPTPDAERAENLCVVTKIDEKFHNEEIIASGTVLTDIFPNLD